MQKIPDDVSEKRAYADDEKEMLERNQAETTDAKKEETGVMANVPEVEREEIGNEIVREKLEELRFTCTEPEKHFDDMIAIKDVCRIPIQAKPLPLTRTNNQTSVLNPSLERFVGLYVVWVERRNEKNAFLFIPDEIFRSIMHERGYIYPKVGQERPHKNRWFLYIPRSLKGFEQYADDTIPDRYCKDKQGLLDELRRNRSDS